MKINLVILLFAVSFVKHSFAQTKVESFNLLGTEYTVTKNFPDDIIGLYNYEGVGEPIIKLESNGFGLFQPHMVEPIKIEFWIDCDADGTIRKQEGVNGRYQYTLLIKYLDGSNGNYPVGKLDLMGVMVLPDLGYVSIYGERLKPL
jgi:hypothetical protein